MLLSRTTLIARVGPPWLAFTLACAAAASAVYWTLSLQGLSAASPSMAADSRVVAIEPAQVLSALTAGSPTQDAHSADQMSTWRLLGVLRQGQAGAALIALDANSPAKAYTVGAVVVDGWQLQSVLPRQVVLVRGGLTRTLALGLALGGASQAGAATGMPGVVEMVPATPVPAPQQASPVPVPATGGLSMSSETAGTPGFASPPRMGN